MKKQKSTPGPWRAERQDESDGSFTRHISGPNSEAITNLYEDIPFPGEQPIPQRANVTLITAAPDLLAACEVALEVYRQIGTTSANLSTTLERALAKAYGVHLIDVMQTTPDSTQTASVASSGKTLKVPEDDNLEEGIETEIEERLASEPTETEDTPYSYRAMYLQQQISNEIRSKYRKSNEK